MLIETFLADFTKQIENARKNAKKKDPIENQPAQSKFKHFDFTAVAKCFTNPEGKPKAKIDLQMDAAQLFFDFMDGQYRAFLYACILQKNEPADNVRYYKLSYSEEEFTRVMQSKESLFITVSPPKHGDIRILVIDPAFASDGVQSVQIQP
jgi:hypothetical protein